MKIGFFVHKIHQFEPDTGKNTHSHTMQQPSQNQYHYWVEKGEVLKKKL